MVQYPHYTTPNTPVITTLASLDAQADTVVLLVDQQQWQQATTTGVISDSLDSASNSQLLKAASIYAFTAKTKQVLNITSPAGSHYNQVVVIGLGDLATSLSMAKASDIGACIYSTLHKISNNVSVDIQALPPQHWQPMALGLLNASYTFNHFKTSDSAAGSAQLHTISLVHSNANATNAINFASHIYAGQSIAKNLANLPANICHPEYMADSALALQAQYPDLIKVTVLDEDKMEKLGMGCFLAVSKGSNREGRLVIIEYKGGSAGQAPVALVGKGVTFDTGGISLKPGAGMDEMKYDMAGAASVLGVMHSLCQAKLAINVVGALACAENMPSGIATRPGDIVTSMSGQTVEILNTDAEGRLVLCDTLTYIQQYNPSLIIDIATLTGACVVALGKVVTGLFTADCALAEELTTAGNQIFDRVWAMPLLDDYQELLDSPFADMANIGGPTGGAITAACFLARYTKGQRWAHLDIAGTGWVSGKNKCGTGRPVPLLMQFLYNQANA